MPEAKGPHHLSFDMRDEADAAELRRLLGLAETPGGQTAPAARRNKYNARKTEVEGEVFDSKKEARVWLGLKARERAGEIRGLRRQVPYELRVNGTLVCRYLSDFEYDEADTGRHVTLDVKGVKTPAYRLKKKLMKAIHGIDVEEV